MHKGKLYVKFFAVLTVTIFVLLITLSLVLTKSFEAIVQKKIYDDTLLNLEQSSRFSYAISDMMAKLTHQIYYDGDTARLLFLPLPAFYELNPLLQQLGNYINAIPFIDSVYVYNRPAGYVFVGSSYQNGKQEIAEFDDEDFLKLLANGRQHRILTPIPRKVMIDTLSGSREKSFYTYFFYDWLNEKESIDKAIAVNISAEWLNSQVTGDLTGGDIIIVNRSGTILSDGDRYPMLTDISSRSFLSRALNDSENGYYRAEADGEGNFIAYTAYGPLGWKFIRIIPYTRIENEIGHIQRTTLYIALSILFCGLIISLISSRKLYQPVEKIRENLRVLREEEERSRPKLIRLFLEELLLGPVGRSVEELRALMRKYALPFEPEKTFFLVLIKPDRWKERTAGLSHEKTNLLLEKIQDRADRVFSRYFRAVSLEQEHSRIILILSPRDESVPADRALFSSLADSLKGAGGEENAYTLSMAVSEMGDSIYSVHRLFAQTSKASLHRIFRGAGSLIFSDEIKALNENKYFYPEEKEKRLIKLLMSGDIEEAKNQYLEIIVRTADYSILVLNLVVSRLMYTISEVLKNFQADGEFDSLLTDSGFFIEATGYESLDEINGRFFAILDRYGELLSSKKNARGIELVKKIEDQVGAGYSRPVLSIDSIAEALGLSPAHLERTYKQKTGKTIHELITETRMERARELLLKTDMAIQDVAENVGYSYNSYFANAFKKNNGLTPTQFRRNGGGSREEV